MAESQRYDMGEEPSQEEHDSAAEFEKAREKKPIPRFTRLAYRLAARLGLADPPPDPPKPTHHEAGEEEDEHLFI